MGFRAIAAFRILILLLVASGAMQLLRPAPALCAYPVTFTDSAGHEISVLKRPSRIVSLVPDIDEMLFELGAGDAVRGITYHTDRPREAAEKTVVGGFFSPSIREIERLEPDLIFVSDIHREVGERFRDRKCLVVSLENRSVSEACAHIRLLGEIFGCEQRAASVLEKIRRQLEVVRQKVEKVPQDRRRRVVRLMGHDPVTAPGDDSFQNEFIRLAGGIAPRWGRTGDIVPVSIEQWTRFNPQMIYACGGNRAAVLRSLNRPGWGDVEAVRGGRILYFPCDLTCRASVRTGEFVSWLAASVYGDSFSARENLVLPEEVRGVRPIELPLGSVKEARIAYSHIYDFLNKSLIIDFREPVSLVSTLEGYREGIRSIGNHFSPPPCWSLEHDLGLDAARGRAYEVIRRSPERDSFLFTGADMDHLAVWREGFEDMEVHALVTAGVETNAVRMARDEGRFYEPGTINILVLANMKLTPRAMNRAIISATEAKTAALQDLDIRSSENPRLYGATGTGTDNIIVVSGTGRIVDNAGGHSKMGELIARAVYAAVQEAIARQNGIVAKRPVFHRLKERDISLFGMISEDECECGVVKSDLLAPLEKVLMEPKYSGFVTSAFALSDAVELGLTRDKGSFEYSCRTIAEEIAGKKIRRMIDLVAYKDLPPVLHSALNALLNGVYYRMIEE